MPRVKITVMKMVRHDDLIAKYENPIDHPCDMHVGDTFYVDSLIKPDGLCDSAWDTLKPFVDTLLAGGGNFFDGWMRDPQSAMVSCNDGFRPVTFYVECEK